MTTALVTGGAGYLGSLLADRLRALDYTVRIFDIADSPEADICDPAAIAAACEGVDIVFHNVAQVPLARNNELFWRVNRDGTRNLLVACEARRVRKVVYTSSSAIYGVPASNPVTEETVPAPREEYGRAKLAGEQLCREFAARGLDVSIVRPRTIMGPGRLGIFQVLFEWIFEGKNIPVLNGGRNRYQFVHGDDLVEALILAANHSGSDDFNCGAREFGTMREVLERVCAHAATGSRVKSLPMWLITPVMTAASALRLSPLAPYHTLMYGRSMYFDITKAERILNWRPRYSNDQMFLQTYDWYVANREAILHSTHASPHRSPLKQRALSLLHWFF